MSPGLSARSQTFSSRTKRVPTGASYDEFILIDTIDTFATFAYTIQWNPRAVREGQVQPEMFILETRSPMKLNTQTMSTESTEIAD
jgi:hypothetical protein